MKQRFTYTELSLAGLVRIDRHPSKDQRGVFSRFFLCGRISRSWFQQTDSAN